MNIIQREDVDNKTIYIDENQKLAVKLEWAEPRDLGLPKFIAFENGKLIIKENGYDEAGSSKQAFFFKKYLKDYQNYLPNVYLATGSEAQEFGDYPSKFPTEQELSTDVKRVFTYVEGRITIPYNPELKNFRINVASYVESSPYFIDVVRPLGWFSTSVNELEGYAESFEGKLQNMPEYKIVHPNYPTISIEYELSRGHIYVVCTDTSSFTENISINLGIVLYHDNNLTKEENNYPNIYGGLKPEITSITLKANDEEKKLQHGAYGGIYNADTETVTWG